MRTGQTNTGLKKEEEIVQICINHIKWFVGIMLNLKPHSNLRIALLFLNTFDNVTY